MRSCVVVPTGGNAKSNQPPPAPCVPTSHPGRPSSTGKMTPSNHMQIYFKKNHMQNKLKPARIHPSIISRSRKEPEAAKRTKVNQRTPGICFYWTRWRAPDNAHCAQVGWRPRAPPSLSRGAGTCRQPEQVIFSRGELRGPRWEREPFALFRPGPFCTCAPSPSMLTDLPGDLS